MRGGEHDAPMFPMQATDKGQRTTREREGDRETDRAKNRGRTRCKAHRPNVASRFQLSVDEDAALARVNLKTAADSKLRVRLNTNSDCSMGTNTCASASVRECECEEEMCEKGSVEVCVSPPPKPHLCSHLFSPFAPVCHCRLLIRANAPRT